MNRFENPKLQLRKFGSELIFHSGLLNVLQKLNSPSWRIVMYHRIVAPETLPHALDAGMHVRPETFRMQMEYLRQSSHVVSLPVLLQELQTKKKIKPRTVAITFDDGWIDNYTMALPVLRELKLPATIFLPTGLIGSNRASAVLDNIQKDPQERCFLNWAEIKEMEKNYISFGSHSHLHKNLAQMNEAEICEDMDLSLARLREENIWKVNAFCYPRGDRSELSQQILGGRYNFGFATAGSKKGNFESSPKLLGRIGIHQDISSSVAMFATRVWS